MSPSVLITGASSGIGAAVAARLLGGGFRVYGTSRHPDSLAAARPELRWLAMDVREDESVRHAVAEVLAEAGELDALVCNAGYGIFGSVEEVSLEAAHEQFETNFYGALRSVRAALPSMRARGSGRIVVVGSLAGRAPIPFQAHYSASKAALDALVMALRNELHGSGVWATLVEPGDIDTPFNAAMDWGEPTTSAYGERLRTVERAIRDSLPRAPGPDVVARAVERALRARRPRVRYAVGSEAAAVALGRRLLPDRIALWLIRRAFGLR
jgi:NAD(P)-dependent dehydrogenase (short-subunit alcohol dehydrogenase family)